MVNFYELLFLLSSSPTENKKKKCLDEGLTDTLDNTITKADDKYSVSITKPREKTCFSQHYNAGNY